MVRSQMMWVAVVAAVGSVGSAVANPIVFTSGSRHVEVRGSGGLDNQGTQRYYTASPNNGNFAAATGSASASNSSQGAPNLASAAAFSHSVTAFNANISGTSSATRSGTGPGSAYGLSSPNSGFGSPSGFGYLTNFNLTQAGAYTLNLTWNPTTANTGGDPDAYSYSDFVGFLYAIDGNRVYALGGSRFDFGNSVISQVGEPDPSNLAGVPNGTPVTVVGLGNTSLNLAAGQYRLYLQSQSYVQGIRGEQSANTVAGISLTAAVIPEPLSVAVFGGLLAAGGLVARRRMAKATA